MRTLSLTLTLSATPVVALAIMAALGRTPLWAALFAIAATLAVAGSVAALWRNDQALLAEALRRVAADAAA